MTGRTQLSVDLVARVGGFEAGMRRAANAAEAATRKISTTSVAAGAAIGTALGNVAVDAFNAFTGSLRNAIDEADRLGEVSERLGLATEEFTSLGYAAQLSGIEIDKFAAANRNLGLRLEENEDLFGRLGVETENADGTYRSTTDIIRDLADAFAEMPEGVEQSRIAAEIFGAKLGNEMIPLLNRGKEEIVGFEEQAAILGATLDGNTSQAAGNLKDNLDRLKIITTSVAREVIPALNDGLQAAVVFFIALKTRVQQAGVVMGYAVVVSEQLIESLSAQLSRFGDALTIYDEFFNNGFEAGFDKWKSTWEKFANEPRRALLRAGGEFVRLQQELFKIESDNGDLAVAFIGSTGSRTQGGVLPEEETDPTRPPRVRKVRERESESDRRMLEAKRAMADADRAAAEARKRLKEETAEARAQEREQLQAYMVELEDELALLGMSNEEREITNALRYAGVDAMSAEGKAIAEKIRAINEAREELEAAESVRNAFSDTFASILDGTSSVKDAFSDLASYITQLVARRLGDQLAESLFGKPGTALGSNGNGFGQLVGNFFGSLFGGPRAAGGFVAPGKMYEVAERGPELLTVGGRQYLLPTATGGMVTANPRMGRGGSVTQNINVTGRVDSRTASQLAAEASRAQRRVAARFGA